MRFETYVSLLVVVACLLGFYMKHASSLSKMVRVPFSFLSDRKCPAVGITGHVTFSLTSVSCALTSHLAAAALAISCSVTGQCRLPTAQVSTFLHQSELGRLPFASAIFCLCLMRTVDSGAFCSTYVGQHFEWTAPGMAFHIRPQIIAIKQLANGDVSWGNRL